jgi:hypothetical protein
MRRGAFEKHFGRRKVTADVNQAVFFSKAPVYRVCSWTKNVSTDLNVNRTWFYFLNQLGT